MLQSRAPAALRRLASAIVVFVVAAGDREVAAVVHELAQLLADLEEGEALGRDVDGGAGARVPPCVRLVRAHGEATVPTDFDALAAFQRLDHAVEDAVHDQLGPGLRQLLSAGLSPSGD